MLPGADAMTVNGASNYLDFSLLRKIDDLLKPHGLIILCDSSAIRKYTIETVDKTATVSREKLEKILFTPRACADYGQLARYPVIASHQEIGNSFAIEVSNRANEAFCKHFRML